MLTNDYSLHYWLGRGIFACETHEGSFVEFRVGQLLSDGNSALLKLLIEQERCGRDMEAGRVELTALQQMANAGGCSCTLVDTTKLSLRKQYEYQNVGGHRRGHVCGWVWDVFSNTWIRSGDGN